MKNFQWIDEYGVIMDMSFVNDCLDGIDGIDGIGGMTIKFL